MFCSITLRNENYQRKYNNDYAISKDNYETTMNL